MTFDQIIWTSSVRFSHDVLVHLKKGTDTLDLLNINIDPTLWPKNHKKITF